MIANIQELSYSCPQPDVLIIGSGAAGMAAAVALSATGMDVLVLAGGSKKITQERQDLYQVTSTALPHGGSEALRFRVYGGSTQRWAGQALRLEPIDFRSRSWVPESGWPIAWDELSGWYTHALRFLGIDPHATSDSRPHSRCPPNLTAATVTVRYSRFAPHPRLRSLYGHHFTESSKLHLALDAHCTTLALDSNGRSVSVAEVKDLRGQRQYFPVKVVLLATGGIENPRLLLASQRAHNQPFGSGARHIGRYFMDHPGFVVPARWRRDAGDILRSLSYGRDSSAGKFGVFLAASESLQARREIVHTASAALFPSPGEAVSRVKSFPRYVVTNGAAETARELSKIVMSAPHVTRCATHRYLRRQAAFDPRGSPVVSIGGEQRPTRDSFVALGEEEDALGMKRAVVHWRVTPLDARSYRTWAEELSAAMSDSGWGELDLSSLPSDDDPGSLPPLVDAGHHMGTTRMSADPQFGVVDRDCKVHGVENLFILGSSVFSTGGMSNPTLTLIALAQRTADHIVRRVV